MSELNELSDLEKIKFIIKGYLKDYIAVCYSYDFKHDETSQTIDVTIKKTEKDSVFILLRLGISDKNQELYIYNIYLPEEDRGQNLGFGVINVLFQVTKVMSYNLVLHSMVGSFYNAMLKRGAIQTLEPDCLQVTDDTDLGELRLNE